MQAKNVPEIPELSTDQVAELALLVESDVMENAHVESVESRNWVHGQYTISDNNLRIPVRVHSFDSSTTSTLSFHQIYMSYKLRSVIASQRTRLLERHWDSLEVH